MKNLEEFVSEINEGRPKGSKNKVPGAPSFNQVDGKTPEQNGSKHERVKWALNEPTDNDTIEDNDIDLNDPDNTKSVKKLIDKFDAEEDFFIEGRAGWGKTSIIKKLAKKYGRDVITVYLDKAEATDLGGIPVPVQGNKTHAKVKNALGKEEEREFAVQIKAMPSWAKLMLDNPDRKFLLFFDEMNQAAPDVMNALMPIVLEHEICEVKFDNFFVGSAGNLEEENEGGINQLSGPLKSRFKPIITWETNTPAAWKQTFKHLHKEWDDKLGKEFVDAFEQASNENTFENPREIEHKIFRFVEKLKALGDTGRVDPERYLDRLEDLSSEDITRTQRDKVLPKLAELMAACIKGQLNKSAEDSNASRSRGKGKEMIPDEIKSIIKNGITRGYMEVNGDDHKYGCSKENIVAAVISACEAEENEDEKINAEMVQMYIDKLEEDGIEYKYKTDDEWKRDKLSDPLNALRINKHTKAKQEKEIEKPINKTKRYDNR